MANLREIKPPKLESTEAVRAAIETLIEFEKENALDGIAVAFAMPGGNAGQLVAYGTQAYTLLGAVSSMHHGMASQMEDLQEDVE